MKLEQSIVKVRLKGNRWMENKRPILKNKVYLYLTEFFAGMSVMAVELGASRLLAPYFSSSQIVWTIIIGTIMIAMALGNLYGGKKADQDPNPDKLYGRILFAAIWIAAIPVLGKYIILGISGLLIFTVNSNFLVVAGFLACAIIFVFPLFLLGTVTPSLVKYSMESMDESGRLVGKLNASNTIGSIIGTFVPTFISIPAVGTSITFLIFAGILLILSLVYFIYTKDNILKVKKVPVAIGLFLICFILGQQNSFAFWQSDLRYEGESVYNYLQVSENEKQVILSTNVLFGVQSVYQKEDGLTGMYYDYALAAPFMSGVHQKDNSDILILGNGTGTFVSQCKNYFTNVSIEGVEIDEKITMLANRYFELPKDVKVTTYDGRAYLNATKKKFDVIMVDAYQDITIPFQMSTVEFFQLVKDHLTTDGVMIVNMNIRGSKEGNINQYLSDTISSVFSNVYVANVEGSTNQELFATNQKDCISNLEENIKLEGNVELREMMENVQEKFVRYQAGDYLMTDDKAPVELLGMKAIDELIRAEVSYYKNIYKEQGLKGLLNSL